jgi:hypothetical protein
VHFMTSLVQFIMKFKTRAKVLIKVLEFLMKRPFVIVQVTLLMTWKDTNL